MRKTDLQQQAVKIVLNTSVEDIFICVQFKK